MTRRRRFIQAFGALRPWQISAICVALALVITACMSILFRGTIAADYIVTCLVAAVVLSYSVSKILSLSRAELEQRIRDRTAALHTSEERLRTIYETEPECVKLLDSSGRLLDMNPAGLAMIEADSLAQARQIGLTEVIAPSYRAAFNEMIAAVFRGESRAIEFESIGLRGTRRWLETRSVPVRDPDEGGGVKLLLGVTRDITDRKKTLAALTESENRFRATFEQAAVGIAHVGPDGRFLRVNRKFCEITGYPAHELMGLDFQAITHPDDLEADLAYVRAMLAGEIDTYTMEKRYIRKNGSVVWIRLTVALVPGAMHKPGYFISVIEDITPQKETTEALKRSEASLASAQRMARIGSWELEIKSGALSWSDEVFRIFEIDKNRFGASYEAFLNLVHPDDRDMVNEAYTASLANRTQYELIHRLRMADGRIKYVHEHCRTDYDEKGQPIRSLGTVQDVTDQRRAGEQLRKLSQAVEQSSNIILITDAKGTIEYVNPKFTEVTGYTLAEIVGTTPASFGSRLTEKRKYKDLWDTLTAGREWRGEFLNRKKNGELFWCEEHIAPIRDNNGTITHFVAVETDITERRKIREQFEQAQKMETAGRLAGGVAHDFNNLLMIIQGNLELLRERLAKDPGAIRLADRALHAAGRSGDLVSQLLVFSRRQVLQPQAVDVGALIARMRDLLRSMLMESIAVTISIPDDLWHALVDPAQIENALLNLAFNARDAMPDGGALTIDAANVELAPGGRLATDSGAAPGPYVRISVADTGTGMLPEVLKRAFEPFFTTKDVGKGSGLGLSMVYGFVKQSGGHIEIESAPGRGTRVHLYLKKTEPERVAEPPSGESALAASGETILVVEDNPEVRETAVAFLRELGYRTIEAADGPAAVVILESKRTVDLLFSDIVMPGGMNGVELARRAHALRPNLKLLFTTGYAEDAAPFGVSDARAAAVLNKPYRKRDLARAVREALTTTPRH